MERIKYRVISIDDQVGTAAELDTGFDEFKFGIMIPRPNVGDLISAIPSLEDRCWLTEVMIEQGRHAQTERAQFETQGDGYQNQSKTFGSAFDEKPPRGLRNSDSEINGAERK